MKRWTSLIIVMILAFGCGRAFFLWNSFSRTAAALPDREITVDIPPGSTLYVVQRQLAQQNISIHPLAFRIWLRWQGKAHKLRIGEYRVHTAWSPARILQEVLTGNPILYRMTIKEGYNRWDIEKEFTKVWGAAGERKFRELLTSGERLEKMQIPRTFPQGAERTLEGFLFPETYSYMKYDTPESLVDAMLGQFQNRALPLIRQHPWGNTPEGLYRLLTLASIVEKESGNPQEQPLVASVFWNRLKKKMRLQSDPTTIYALFPSFDGNLKKIHLTTPSPYNTYTLPELPAGPICNPGESALRAVIHPAETSYLYFVGRRDGTHEFSNDYATHAKNVRRFQLRQH